MVGGLSSVKLIFFTIVDAITYIDFLSVAFNRKNCQSPPLHNLRQKQMTAIWECCSLLQPLHCVLQRMKPYLTVPKQNFSEILMEIYVFSFKKMHLKISSGYWQPFSLGLSVLNRPSSILCIIDIVYDFKYMILVRSVTVKYRCARGFAWGGHTSCEHGSIQWEKT